MARSIKKNPYKKEDIINKIVSKRIEEMATTRSILDYLMKEVGYGQSYSYELIRESRDKIKELYDKISIGKLEEAILQIEMQMEKANNRGDMKHWIELRKELNKITGLYQDKIEISGSLNHNVNVIKLVEIKKEDTENK